MTSSTGGPTCWTYFSTDAVCPENRGPLWTAGHLCAEAPGHLRPHRCACGAVPSSRG